MMRPSRRLRWAAAALLTPAILAPTEAGAQSGRRVPDELVRGREVTFRAAGSRVSGELLAVDGERLVLLRDATLTSWALDEVGTVYVRQHGLGFRESLVWAGVGGLLTGVALQSACDSVEGADCGGLAVVVLGLWALVGAPAAWAIGSSSTVEVVATEATLRPWARFPQGLPDVFRTRAVGGLPGGGRVRR